MSSPEEFIPVGEPVDLDNCAREPIHIPGSIQPRGVLLVAHEPDLTVTQVSANVATELGVEVDAALGGPLAGVLGDVAAATIARASSAFGDLRERNPLELDVVVNGVSRPFDVILHRAIGGLLLVELEQAYGPRPFSFPNTYLAVRGAVAELNRAVTLPELYGITARAVRDLTGFDRVMVYRYDHEYNGEVVAEAKHEELNSFLGQRYPASDIPAQARALYEKNWLRLISDIDYTPVPIVPTLNPLSDESLDLTYSTLRSVSPIHVEYLVNMGVHASMSISLLRDGKLWGLIACHHYAGPHLPPYGVRAAAEFLGSTLSLRLVDRSEDDELRQRVASSAVLAKLTAAMMSNTESVSASILGAPDLLDLIPAAGVVVSAGDGMIRRGTAPDDASVEAIAAWALGSGEEVVSTDSLRRDLPSLAMDPAEFSGALVMVLPDNRFAMWLRPETRRDVDWGGDPHNKAIAVREGDSVRLSPRKSFERWREVVRDRSVPWTSHEVDLAGQLRRHVVEALFARSQNEVRLAETLQRSLLPELPEVEHWALSAYYEPAAGGRIGGDWYDALRLPDGRLAVVLGDVAGHGISAAGVMAQLRNALRAYLFDGRSAADALARLNDFAVHLLPGAFATGVVACVDVTTGRVEAACAGHPVPLHTHADRPPTPAPIATSPPLGVPAVSYRTSEFELAPGDGLVLFSDGLIERRDEDIAHSLTRLAAAVATFDADASAEQVFRSVSQSGTGDDATVVVLHRPSRPADG